MQRTLVFVQMLDELGNAALVIKLVRLFALVPLVLDEDADAFVQERLFAKPLGELFKAVIGRLENARIGPERDLCTAFLWSYRSVLSGATGMPASNSISCVFAVAPDLEPQIFAKEIDAANADAV